MSRVQPLATCAVWCLALLASTGCGRSHGTGPDDSDGTEDAAVDAATPRDMAEPDAFDIHLALGCFWETVEVSPDVSLRGVHGRWTFGESHPVWLVGGDGAAFGWEDGPPLQVVPTGDDALLSSAWHDDDESLWATELPGTMMRLRDGEWERVESDVSEALLAVDGTAPDSAWAVGIRGVMARWNGDSWTALPSLVPHHLTGVSALAPDDVWAVGSTDTSGVVLHYDGDEWSVTEVEPRLHDVSAHAPDDVWAVGSTVLHWDGRSWSEVDVGESGEWGAVIADDARVWIAGVANRVMTRYRDDEWITALEDVGFLWDIWTHPGTGDVWVAGEGVAHRCVPFFL